MIINVVRKLTAYLIKKILPIKCSKRNKLIPEMLIKVLICCHNCFITFNIKFPFAFNGLVCDYVIFA